MITNYIHLLSVFMQTQDAYDEYCIIVRRAYSDEFWRFFESVYQERCVIIDRVLKKARDVLVMEENMKQKFDPSVRLIRERMLREAGDFKAHVMHEITIDLRKFDLPFGDMDEVKFRFVNPLWAWVTAANNMVAAGHRMHFEPKTMFHETTNQRLYGAGVSYGCKLKV